MAHSNETRAAVRQMFIHGNDLKGACDQYGVSYETGRNWKRVAKAEGDDWDVARAAYRLSTSDVGDLTAAIIEKFIVLFESTIKQIDEATDIDPMKKAEAIAKLADSYHKTVSAAKSSSKKLSALSVSLDVMKRLSQFIEQKYPQHKAVFAEILTPFGKELTRHYG